MSSALHSRAVFESIFAVTYAATAAGGCSAAPSDGPAKATGAGLATFMVATRMTD